MDEIIIDDRIYDVSKFKHPGGNIIKYYKKDATNAFHQFHLKSQRAELILNTLPSRPVQDNFERSDLTKDFERFTIYLKNNGFFDPVHSEIICRLLEIYMIVLFGYILHNRFFLFSCLLIGIASGRCGWLMHEAGHYSFTGNIQIDKFLQIVIYGAGCGMSASWWRSQHNRHHATPQHENKDPDLATLPLVAFNKCILPEKMNAVMSRYLKYQLYLFPFITTSLVSLYWRYYLHVRTMIKNLYNTKTSGHACLEMVSYILYHLFLMKLLKNDSQKLLTYLFINGISSSYIFIHFAMSHSHLPVTKNELNWVEYSAYHTTNVATNNIFVTWWMSNLNYQIEHHLFPSMPQCNHKRISPLVKSFFKSHDLPYQDGDYFELLFKTLCNLHNVSNEIIH